MVYLSFVQQLDRDADGARHGEDDDAEFCPDAIVCYVLPWQEWDE